MPLGRDWTSSRSVSRAIVWGLALASVFLVLALYFIVRAEPPRYLSWSANQFMDKVKVTRYLANGSGIEHKYGTFKARKVCNGWFTEGEMAYQTCGIRFDDMEDLNYSYRIREIDADGRQIRDLICHPLNLRWECGPVSRGER